jgi:hypothetical protein
LSLFPEIEMTVIMAILATLPLPHASIRIPKGLRDSTPEIPPAFVFRSLP